MYASKALGFNKYNLSGHVNPLLCGGVWAVYPILERLPRKGSWSHGSQRRTRRLPPRFVGITVLHKHFSAAVTFVHIHMSWIGKILSDWESLGLSASPNVGENGVHASASPFEGIQTTCIVFALFKNIYCYIHTYIHTYIHMYISTQPPVKSSLHLVSVSASASIFHFLYPNLTSPEAGWECIIYCNIVTAKA